MSVHFTWPGLWDADFVEGLRHQLEDRLRQALKSPAADNAIIKGLIRVDKLDLGSKPPTIQVLNVPSATADYMSLEVAVSYSGDAMLAVSGVEVNIDPLHRPDSEERDTTFAGGDANHAQPFVINFTGRIVDIVLEGKFLVEVSHKMQPKQAHGAGSASASAGAEPNRDIVTPTASAPTSPTKEKPRFRVAAIPHSILARRASERRHAADGDPYLGGGHDSAAVAGGYDPALSPSMGSFAPSMHSANGGAVGGHASFMRSMASGRAHGTAGSQGLREDMGMSVSPRRSLASAATCGGGPHHSHAHSLYGGAPGAFSATSAFAGAGAWRGVSKQGPLAFSTLSRVPPTCEIVRSVCLKCYEDPIKSFKVESNFSPVVGDNLSHLLRMVLRPVVRQLKTDGIQWTTTLKKAPPPPPPRAKPAASPSPTARGTTATRGPPSSLARESSVGSPQPRPTGLRGSPSPMPTTSASPEPFRVAMRGSQANVPVA
jgi:hypothetical protein